MADDVRDADAAHRVTIAALGVEVAQETQPVEECAVVIVGGVHANIVRQGGIRGLACRRTAQRHPPDRSAIMSSTGTEPSMNPSRSIVA